MSKKVIVLGAGVTGMSVAAYLALNGFEVEIFEKNDSCGGRARHFQADGFTFDRGSSWYCLPEIINEFFKVFDHSYTDFFSLKETQPTHRIYFDTDDFIDISLKPGEMEKLFGTLEKNGDQNLFRYKNHAKTYYNKLVKEFQNVNSYHEVIRHFRSSLLSRWINSHNRIISRYFDNPKIIKILNFLTSYSGLGLNNESNWILPANFTLLDAGYKYPDNGFYKLIEALESILRKLKVLIYCSSSVESFDIINNKVAGIITHGKTFHADIFISTVDYSYTEQLLPREFRNYNENYWDMRKSGSSTMIYFIGFDKIIKNIAPITTVLKKKSLFNLPMNKSDFGGHTNTIYITSPSKLDEALAPKGKDSLIIRMTVPIGIEDTGKMRGHYYFQILEYLEQLIGESLSDHVIYKKSYSRTDFEDDRITDPVKYTYWLKSRSMFGSSRLKIKNKHLHNLFYIELPVFPGSGISSALFTGKIAAYEIMRTSELINYE